MRKLGLLILISCLISSSFAIGQEIYQWVDEKGSLHFADDLSLVPERYRNQVLKKPPKEPSLLPSPQVSKEVEERKSEPPREPKDLVGRGEEWWRTRAKEWDEKLLYATKNYDAAYAAWKAKENELEQSKFKSQSLKRKLKAEIKVLEAKAKEWEKERDQAKNMLEKVLPREAEELKADPNWIKIEK